MQSSAVLEAGTLPSYGHAYGVALTGPMVAMLSIVDRTVSAPLAVCNGVMTRRSHAFAEEAVPFVGRQLGEHPFRVPGLQRLEHPPVAVNAHLRPLTLGLPPQVERHVELDLQDHRLVDLGQ